MFYTAFNDTYYRLENPMSRTLVNVSRSESYDVAAKSLKKGDSVWVGKRVHRVSSNEKHSDGFREIRLTWGSHSESDEVRIIVPSKLRFHVRNTTTTRI